MTEIRPKTELENCQEVSRIQGVYQSIMNGGGNPPELMVIKCFDCDKAFTITKSSPNVCEHLKHLFTTQ